MMPDSFVHISTPLTRGTAASLHAGDAVLISGVLYTARDAAHQRIHASLQKKEPLPFALDGQVIYYAGPSPAKPGHVIGSIGPTTAGRMDGYTPALIAAGLKGMIGKGARSSEVIEAMRHHGAVYFGAIGGAAVLLAQCVKDVQIVAYHDLGPEAVRRLVVEDFPVLVVNDCHGEDLYVKGRQAFHMNSVSGINHEPG